mgnify:FL=1
MLLASVLRDGGLLTYKEDKIEHEAGKHRMAPAGYILVILLLWELAVRLFHIPLYILPAPTAIAAALGEEWPVLVSHGAVTVLEALAGILISLILALAWESL